MTYDQLSDAQRAQIQAFEDVYRPILGETARLFAKMERLEDAWRGDGGVGAVLALLDPGTPLQTTTGLAGAGVLFKEHLVETMVDFATALAGFNSPANREAYVRSAGVSATL